MQTGSLDFTFGQQIIDGYIVDFYCHKASLVIEVDGPIHLFQQAYDQERDEQHKSRGLNVLHFSNDEVDANPDSTLKKIKAILKTFVEAP